MYIFLLKMNKWNDVCIQLWANVHEAAGRKHKEKVLVRRLFYLPGKGNSNR